MAGHAQLKFVMTECSKTQIRLTRHIFNEKIFRESHNQRSQPISGAKRKNYSEMLIYKLVGQQRVHNSLFPEGGYHNAR